MTTKELNINGRQEKVDLSIGLYVVNNLDTTMESYQNSIKGEKTQPIYGFTIEPHQHGSPSTFGVAVIKSNRISDQNTAYLDVTSKAGQDIAAGLVAIGAAESAGVVHRTGEGTFALYKFSEAFLKECDKDKYDKYTHAFENYFAKHSREQAAADRPVTSAKNRSAEGFCFSVKADGTYELTGTEGGISGDVMIPPYVNGVPVTSIAARAFIDQVDIEHVVIPDTITAIGAQAFANNYSLLSIEIPASVKSVEDGAFCNCIDAKVIRMTTGLEEIGKAAFYNCHSAARVTIPGSVEEIKESAFEQCTNLRGVAIADGVRVIGEKAFKNCPINELSIEGKDVCIKDGAFDGNTYFADIYSAKEEEYEEER